MSILSDPIISQYLYLVTTITAGAVCALLLLILLIVSALFEATGEERYPRVRRILWIAIIPLLVVFSGMVALRLVTLFNSV